MEHVCNCCLLSRQECVFMACKPRRSGVCLSLKPRSPLWGEKQKEGHSQVMAQLGPFQYVLGEVTGRQWRKEFLFSQSDICKRWDYPMAQATPHHSACKTDYRFTSRELQGHWRGITGERGISWSSGPMRLQTVGQGPVLEPQSHKIL